VSYFDTPDETTAQDEVRRLYEADRARLGYVANYTKVFALRPAVIAAWAALNTTIRAGMDLRRYELATLAAARQLRSSYCSLAHGGILREKFYDTVTVAKLAADHRRAGLAPVDIAIMDFAVKVAADATAITAADIAALRCHGLDDIEIFQVVLAAAGRCFFSTAIAASGAQPDAELRLALSG
jgi:uncharacterized peroxidase-related enzyme